LDENERMSTEENQEYFTSIFNDHFESLSKYVLFKSPSFSDAEDIVSSTFASFFQYVVLKNKRPDNVFAYLVRTANHELHHFYLQRKKVISFDFTDQELIDQMPDEMDLEESVFEQFEADKLWQEIRVLPEIDQKILIARYRFDMPYREIADSLGNKFVERAVRLRCHRALKKLHRLLLK